MHTLIITRHAGLVAWLAARGIIGEVIEQAEPADVAGRDVVGVLPFHLACQAASVTVVDLPGLSREQRGQDLSPEAMDAAGATVRRYVIREEALI